MNQAQSPKLPDGMNADGSRAEGRLAVALGDRSYDILVGSGLLDRAGALMKPLLASPRVFIVTDQNVAPLYLDRLTAALDREGVAHGAVVLAPGEQAKSFDGLESLLDRLLAARCERGTTLVALGGGVIGDLTGFAASILLRGVSFVQIPTTLLAQVDSSVGGKTGINTRHGKNLVGSFHQPRLVIADIGTLDSLPARELKSGYAEIVKYGLIDLPDFFSWLEAGAGRALLAGDGEARRAAVLASCAAKARIVAADEKESGQRALLNLGHTFAHALEAESGYGEALHHGEAVSIGMLMAFDLSERLGLCPKADRLRLAAHLADLGLPTELPPFSGKSWNAERLMAHFAADKKVKDGQVTFVLVKGIGRAFLCRDVPVEPVMAVLGAAIARLPR